MEKTTILLLFLLFFLSFGLTLLIKNLANKHKVIDIPNERSSHSTPTPRGGGLAIVLIWYLGISILFYQNLIEKSIFYALLSGLLLAVVSLADDILNLRPITRLLAQLSTASLSLFFLTGFKAIEIFGIQIDYPILIYPLLIIGIVWFINLFNFLDGIDAYASNETISVLLMFFLFTSNPINLVLIASTAGFLFWNWPKARIFMGDVGSTQLGFVLIVLGLYFSLQKQFSMLEWLLMTSPFWFDATFTLYLRWRNGEKLSQAHKKHAYQRLVQAGFSHKKVNLILVTINLLIFLLILVFRQFEFLRIPLSAATVLILYFLYQKVNKLVPFR
jgi:UDP-N-acetylmuramyl pentapeptide phosphotransferase/UDP-N-acetylglucosamine-1-phosphate transferase